MTTSIQEYLNLYWIELDLHDYPAGFSEIGYGVSAFDYGDALEVLQQMVFRDLPLPKVISVVENVEVSSLDSSVRSLIGRVSRRGIWFPKH
ncbi:MAG: hypothetical protein OHK0046_16050 [Anaerolineae bacterium]